MQSGLMHLLRHVWRLSRNVTLQMEIIGRANYVPLCRTNVYAVEKAIVQLQIEWEQFVRTFILDCATGRYADRSSPVMSNLPSRPPTREKAGHLLVSLYKKRDREPAWYLPRDAIDAAQRLCLSNYQYISAVLGVEPWLLHELRHVRNYISHQSKQSALEMRKNKLATAGRIMAVQSALSYGNDGVQRYLGWATFMKDVSRRLVQ